MRCKYFSFKLICCLTSVFVSSSCYCDPLPVSDSIEKEFVIRADESEVREWLRGKRDIKIKDLGGALSISGDLRLEFVPSSTKVFYDYPVVLDDIHKVDRLWNVFGAIMFDYKNENNWLAVRCGSKNLAGIDGGQSSGFVLARAVFGCSFPCKGGSSLMVEFGRRQMGEIFESDIQGGVGPIEGIRGKYSYDLSDSGQFYAQLMAFVVNCSMDQFAYAGEVGFTNICGSGVYAKVLGIDWDVCDWDSAKWAPYKGKKDLAYRFFPLQFILGWNSDSCFFGKRLNLSGAFLHNVKAKDEAVSYSKREADGFYVDVSIGKLEKPLDYTFSMNYQWVQMQAIPDFDCRGIGRNTKIGLYTTEPKGIGDVLAQGEGIGRGNYKGVSISCNFLATNNITIAQSFSRSVNQNKTIKPEVKHIAYCCSIIYAF